MDLLVADVEIMAAAGDLNAAREAAAELRSLSSHIRSPLLRALAARAEGAVLIANGRPGAALAVLHETLSRWADLNMPYETARLRALMGQARRALGDDDGAQMEFEAAARTFTELGAAPDAAWVRTLHGADGTDDPGAWCRATGLTDREAQVLVLVAGGRTNREIAAALVLSEHTVRRHVQNIFARMTVSAAQSLFCYT